MPRHPALQSLVFLRRTFVAYHPKHQRYDVIATVGEALRTSSISPPSSTASIGHARALASAGRTAAKQASNMLPTPSRTHC